MRLMLVARLIRESWHKYVWALWFEVLSFVSRAGAMEIELAKHPASCVESFADLQQYVIWPTHVRSTNPKIFMRRGEGWGKLESVVGCIKKNSTISHTCCLPTLWRTVYVAMVCYCFCTPPAVYNFVVCDLSNM